MRVLLDDEVSAREIIFRYKGQNISYTDATNFAVMKRLGIGKAFSFDSQFSTVGFIKIPPFI